MNASAPLPKRRWLRLRNLLGLLTAAIFLSPVYVWFVVTQPLPGDKERRPAPLVTPDRLMTHVTMLSHSFAPRDCAHAANLKRTAEYLKQEFMRASAAVIEQPIAVPADFPAAPKGCIETYRNMIAAFGPDTEERVIVSARYDAPNDNPDPDNTTGAVALIELAHLLSVTVLPVRVELAAVALTAPPFAGSPYSGVSVHSASLKKGAVRVRAVISIEGIGNFQDADGSQRYPNPLLNPFYPKRGDFIMIWGMPRDGANGRRARHAMQATSALPAFSANLPESYWPDHLRYEDFGYPTLVIGDTGLYRSRGAPPADTLDYARMVQAIQGLYNVATEFAKLPR